MKKCNSCGKNNEDTAAYCACCGKVFDAVQHMPTSLDYSIIYEDKDD